MSRDAFLARVRQAVKDGNKAGTPPLPDRPATLGYQGAGTDPVGRFRDELVAAGGNFHLTDDAGVVACVMSLVRDAKRVLLGPGLSVWKLESALLGAGIHVDSTAALDDPTTAFFAADVGISGVDTIIAETGTIVMETRPDQPRALSLLPPKHIAIARREQITADLFDLFERETMPACLALITGPSKTGDIELKLVTGVHGPGEVHVVMVS